MSHIRISVRYSWSVQTWLEAVKVKMSVVGRRPFSTIQRPMRRCHQKSGSCSAPTKSPTMTIITPPISRVLAEKRSARFNSGPRAERVGQVAGHAPGIRGALVGERRREHAFLPADAQQLARDEVGDRQGAQPASGSDVDADRGCDLAEVDGVPAEAVGPTGHEVSGLGDDRERTAEVSQAPDRTRQAGGGQNVPDQDQAFAVGPARQEARADRGEGAAEGYEDHRQAVVG